MPGSDVAEQRRLLRAAHHVDQRDLVRKADADQHLPQVRGRGGMHDGVVTFRPHRFDKAERGERVDENEAPSVRLTSSGKTMQSRATGTRRSVGVHSASDHADRPPEQMLDVAPCPDHDTGALISNRHRLSKPTSDAGKRLTGNTGCQSQ